MIDHSSLTTITISLFRSSLLFVALLSTFYAHFSFYLPIFSAFVVFSFLFLIIMFVCKKFTSYEREKLRENKVIVPKGLQNGDCKAIDQSQITDFTINNVFTADLIKSDMKIDFGPHSNKLGPINEPVSEEDCLIEIPLVNQEVGLEEKDEGNLGKVLQQEGHGDFFSDMDEIGEEDNLIEIDISMGSIRHSGSGRTQLKLELAL